jgi:hypothetical protein
VEDEYSMWLRETKPVSEEVDLISYWAQNRGKFPNLFDFALDRLAVPATSGGIERVFSVAGNILGKRRHKLKDSALERLVMIKCNKYMLKKMTW